MHARGPRTGFSMVPRTSWPAQTMDVFLDMWCEDSKATWPTLKALAAARPDVDVRIQLFPLPYNFGSWLPAQSCTAAAMLTGTSQTFIECVDIIYSNTTQHDIKSLALVNGTTRDVIDALVAVLAGPLGIAADDLRKNVQSDLESGPPSYSFTKRALKYGQSNGIFATPSILLNGVQIHGADHSNDGTHAEGGWISMALADWEAMLDLPYAL